MKTGRLKGDDPRFLVPMTAALYVASLGVLLGGMTLCEGAEMEALLTQWVPSFLWGNFVFLCLAGIWCRGELAAALGRLFSRPDASAGDTASPSQAVGAGGRFLKPLARPGWSLLAVVLVGLTLTALVAPQGHRLFYDEDIYANMAQNMALTGRTGMANWGAFEYGEYFVSWLLYNKDPSGWPFLLSLVFRLLGVDETYGFFLNNLLFALGIIVSFFIGLVATESVGAGLFGALLYCLIPHNAIWSNTLAAETSAAFLEGLVVLFTFLWLRDGQWRRLFLLAAVLAFCLAMRPEAGLIVLWVLAAAALNPFGKRPHPLAAASIWAGGAFFLALAIPHLWHLYAMGGQSWGAPGPKFSLAFFLGNAAVNGPYYLNNEQFPLLFTILAAAGAGAGMLGAGIRPQQGRRVAALLMIWFILFWGVFLFFYAGSYKYGADVRFSLLTFMPLAVLGGMGAECLVRRAADILACRPAGSGNSQAAGPGGRQTAAALLITLIILSWLKFLPLVRLVGQEGWGARVDHAFARQSLGMIPGRSIVLTHVPTMFLLWGKDSIQAYAGINDTGVMEELRRRYRGEVYFHWGYWCNAADDENRLVCERISQLYHLEPVAAAREQDNLYGLYRMTER